MADDQTTTNQAEPKGEPKDEAKQDTTPVAEPAPQGTEPEATGRGSKSAVLADLAAERDKRQALEGQFNALRDGFAKAFGFKSDEVTPEQMTAQLAEAQQQSAAAALHLAVFRSTPTGVDADALLDSERFKSTIAGIDPSDTKKIAEKITAFVADNPRFKTATAGAGARDASAGAAPSGSHTSMDDWLRGKR